MDAPAIAECDNPYTELMDTSNPIIDTPEDAQSPAAAPDVTIPPAEEWIAERDRLQAERVDLQERLLRRQAEFENYRRRAEREKADVFEYANTETVRSLLPIVDDFERALKIESADKEYVRGMELIYNRLSDTLKKLGLEPIISSGQTFDPHVHHAVEMFETDSVADHTILEEYQRGYNFKGRLLRPAMVKVAVTKK